MFSKFFIERPVLANVLSIVIVLIGLVAMLGLPIAQYPNVVPPTVQVTTSYPGASAQTLMDTVALPIEEQVNGVQDMLYMQSSSTSSGAYTLTVTFKIGTDLNFAQVLVQNRVSAALASLPASVQAQGVVVQQKSTSILQIVTLSSPTGEYDSLYMSNYAGINITNVLARLPGVGNVAVFGAGSYAMRLWLDPNALKARGLTPTDVINAVKGQSQAVTAGQTGSPPAPSTQAFQYTINIQGLLTTPEQFGDIVIKTGSGAGGQVTRVRDVARIELGAQNYGQTFELNNKPSAGIAIYQQPGANALQVASEVKKTMATLAKSFPQGLTYTVPFDTTLFVTASVDEVYKTLIEAGVLVLIVILVFLQDWRATLVPATTIPITVIGAFAAMAALGFTINLSTLFAIVLSIGIVVDDSIVVVEGSAHQLENGLGRKEAAIQAMKELFGPIIGITLVLMSVFIPASLTPGLTGQMYAQFALVIAATALISAMNAATLTPTQCALFLRVPKPPAERNFLARGFNRGYDGLARWYGGIIRHMTNHAGISVIVALILIVGALWGIARLPTGFLPTEDQGYVIVGAQLPDGASLGRTQQVLTQIGGIIQKVPGVENVIGIGGISVIDNSAQLANAGVAYVMLKPWGERGKGEDLRSIYTNITTALKPVQAAATYVLVPPAIQGIGNASGFTMMLEQRDGSGDFAKLQSIARTVLAAANGQTGIARATTSFRADVPQFDVVIDRVKAESLHVNVGDVFSTISSYVGSTFINQFNEFGLTFQVYAQADSKFRLTIDQLTNLYVKNRDGLMIPVGTLVKIKPAVGPSLISLYNLYPSATIIGGSAPGFSSGQALDLMGQVAAHTLPRGTGFDWTAMSYQEKAAGGQIIYAFGFALILVYLVLCGQYESWVSPVAVLLAVPLALIGPGLTLGLLGVDNNLYVQIGLLLLIALAAKNAILIVEVAREHRIAGRSIMDAARDASHARLRPILMTSFAFMLGVVPLIMATGAGANSRKSIGITVFSGMAASTCLAVLFVPSFYVVLQRFDEWMRGTKKPEKDAGAAPNHGEPQPGHGD
ncbi:efflux RND transporter permease subunit [Acidisoma cellulosilytica]|uniref:Efflux pump membrane transporter n=1 Tax=Acidisoma cellulosilyticum TaxID=2802395 RepID=A0A964E2U7_9PROT|nr:efflux RND transporter permease subunit [Acidisoma cellulosilyticum]MCB8879689.1 efflux RND transporter permease subunit [Acidisoma cellulosilyticum]